MNIQQELQKLSDPVRAIGEKKYLKSPMKHYGVTVPQLHKISKTWVKENQELTIDQVIKFTNKLWSSQYHEERALATEILIERRAELTLDHLPVVEHMVQTAIGWAQLDDIAAWLVGTLYEKYPAHMATVFRHWVKSANFWVRRAALLGQLIPFRHGGGDFALFTELALTQLPENPHWDKIERFFIRKVIGWILRDLSRTRPGLTRQFVLKYQDQMSGLTLREATKYL